MKQKSKKSKRYVLRKCFESSQKKFGACTTKITDCSLFRATLGICSAISLTRDLIQREKWIFELQTTFWVQRSQIPGPTWYGEMIDFWRRIDFRKNIWYTSLSHWWGLENGNFVKSTKLRISIKSQIVNILGRKDMWSQVTSFEPIWSFHHKIIDCTSIWAIPPSRRYCQYFEISEISPDPPPFPCSAGIGQKSSIPVFSSKILSFRQISDDWFLRFFYSIDVPKLADFPYIKFRLCRFLSQNQSKIKFLQNGPKSSKKWGFDTCETGKVQSSTFHTIEVTFSDRFQQSILKLEDCRFLMFLPKLRVPTQRLAVLVTFSVLRGSTKWTIYFSPKTGVFLSFWVILPFRKHTFSTQFLNFFKSIWDIDEKLGLERYVVNVSRWPQKWHFFRSPRFNKVDNLLFTKNRCFLEFLKHLTVEKTHLFYVISRLFQRNLKHIFQVSISHQCLKLRWKRREIT